MENQQDRDKEFYLNSRNFKNLKRMSDFREYLDKTGALDKMTEILIDLYEYPALNAPVLEYTRKRLTDTNPDDEELAKLRPKWEEAKQFRDYLEKENQRLKEEIKKTQNNLIDEGETGNEKNE